ncbi:hypothetical protein, partial [Salinibius halmophilus]|uniref:hypothetical protein n=1 Tax=Salinibius halmophilus TaxID=1853216 RepID=UPI001F445EF7
MIDHAEGLKFCLCGNLHFLRTSAPFLAVQIFTYTLKCEEPPKYFTDMSLIINVDNDIDM